MTGSTSGYDDRTTRQRLATATQYDRDDTLELTVSNRERGPDRGTIAPRECSKAEAVTTWLSADLEAFVDLDERR